jgi:hypothetical protein
VKHACGIETHVVDVHWKIANPQAFADMLSYEELAAVAKPFAWKGPPALGLSDVHAMLVACVHRIAHHLDSEELIWLYDIHLLASRLDAETWDEVVDLATGRLVANVTRRSLERSADCFGTEISSAVWSRLDCGNGEEERTAAYLRTRRPIDEALDDLRALTSWADRYQLAREHCFPPSAYMRATHPNAARVPLAALYVWRLLRAGRRWLAPQKSSRRTCPR